MKRQISSQSWPIDRPYGVKRTVGVYNAELDMLAARRQYADANGFTLLAERPDGLIALYWNKVGEMIRLAIEPALPDESDLA